MRLWIAASLLLGWSVVAAQEPRHVYIVDLVKAPVTSFTGDATLGLKATRPDASGSARLEVHSKAVGDYLKVLDDEHARVLGAVAAVLGRDVAARHDYRFAINGFALELSDAEALRVRGLPGVRAIEVERMEYLHTDAGPEWIGAVAAWSGASGQAPTRGEGVVVGIVDGGINPGHPAFAEVDVEGYRHVNPEGQRFGLCLSTQAAVCNNKLIGIYDMTDEAPRSGNDTEGHGSHVAGIAVGNVRQADITGATTSLSLRVSGVAPRANLITYKACIRATATTPSTCPNSATTAALERAIVDGVDIINYSIGGGAVSPWSSLNGGGSASMRAMAGAARAGIAIAVSAGNEGPIEASVQSPSNSPWVIAVANATHHRKLANTLTELSGANTPPPFASVVGDGFTGGVGPVRLVLGEAQGSAPCSQGTNLDSPPTGISNPWTGRVFNGEIVVCDRGVQARVAKSNNVRLAGGGGMVLVNTAAEGESTVSDDHSLPATHIGYVAGEQLKAWVRANPGGASGRLTGVQALRDPLFGDVLASSSSRGPEPTDAGVLKPQITAPGSSILSAAATSLSEATLSGTSMASPHVAGALALLRTQHPGESFGTLFSALELTAAAGMRTQDGVTPATLLQAGMGRARIDLALATGLVLPLGITDFDRENPLTGGDPSRLNSASLYRAACVRQCSFTRTFKAWRAGTYVVTDTSTGGVHIQATPASFTLGVGQTQTLAITVDVSDPHVLGRWAFGELSLTSSSDSTVPTMHLKSALFSDPGTLPSATAYVSDSDRGFRDEVFEGLVALPALSFVVRGPQAAQEFSGALAADPTPTQVFDNDTGTATFLVELASAGEVRAETLTSTASDLDLFVGRDSNRNGVAEQGELLCVANGPSAIERCTLSEQPAGRYWIRVLNAGATAPPNAFTLAAAAIPTQIDNPKGNATGPATAAANAPIPVRIGYDIGGLKNGQRAFATLELRAGTTADTTFARIPLTFLRSGEAAPAAHYLQADRASRFLIPAGSTHERLVIDVPAGATALTVEMRGSEGNANLYLAKATSDAIGAELAPAPPESAAAASANGPDSNETLTLAAPTLTPGRWYVVARNPGTSSIAVDITARVTSAVMAPFAFETWYNPARDGHGLFFTRAGSSAQVVWYTYRDDGTPTWYLGFPDALTTTSGVASTELYSYVWIDGAAHATRVGRASFTRQDGRLVFDWEIDGQSGSEAMVLLTSSACVNAGAGAFDPSGLWFEPARSGYGINLFARPDVDFAVMYVYDAAGQARWLLGQNPAFGSAPLTLYQYRGYCPACTVGAVTRQAVGSFTRSFDAGAEPTGRWTIAASFAAPLTGSWSAADVASRQLTDRKACAP